jgi:Holliday junction resolvasome RuvABC endonuclease subunit
MGRTQAVISWTPSAEEVRALCVRSPDGGKKASRELALDLSTRCVGWAVGERRDLLAYGKLVVKSTAEVGQRLDALEDALRELIRAVEPERLLLEKPLSRKGVVTMRHNEIVGIVRKVFFEETGGEILDSWIIAPASVKKSLGIERGGSHEENKRLGVERVNQLYGLGLRFHKSSKIETDDDTADAILVLSAYWQRNARRG